jgi:hypothetical protein
MRRDFLSFQRSFIKHITAWTYAADCAATVSISIAGIIEVRLENKILWMRVSNWNGQICPNERHHSEIQIEG